MGPSEHRCSAFFRARILAVVVVVAMLGGVLLVVRDDGSGPTAEEAIPLEDPTPTTSTTTVPGDPVATSTTTTTSTSVPDGGAADSGTAVVSAGLSIRYPDTTFTTGSADRVEPVVRGGEGPRRFSLVSGVLPPGVSLDPATGALSTTAITYDRSYGEEAVDPSFAPVIDGTVLAVAVDHEGRTLVGGDFTSVDGVARRNLARLFADGSVDPTFDPSPSGAVHAIAVDRMHRILIGGDFSSVRGVPTSRIARLAPEGHPDPAFRPEPDGTVRAVAVETDGNLLVGGSFTTIADTPRNRIARLTPTGDADPDFDPGADGTVRAIAREPDGDLLVGGSFTTVAGTPRSHIARLTPTGDADPGFAPAVGGPVHAVAVKADGRILVGGSFATVAGTPRSRIARLTPTGTVDPDFDPGAGNPVSALVVQVDGRILVGGPFISIAGTPRAGLARLGGFTGYPAPLTVRVTDRAGSATATLVLGVETRPPAEPITIRTTAGPAPGSLVITWTPPADTGSGPVTDYVVEYRPVGATGWTTFPDGVSTDPTVVVPDLPTDIGYEFRIIAVNVGGAGPPAASGPDVTRPGPPAVPGAPGTPTAIAAPGSVTLTWRAPSVDGGSPVTDYVVERRAVPSGSWAVVVDGVGTATTAVVGGLGPGEASEFRIAAVNAVGVGAWSGSASATTPTAPSVPGGLTATPGDGQLALTWSAPTDTGGADLLDHAIEYRTAPAGAWTSFADDVSPGTGATITGLANGTAYEVRVAAVNGVGASAWTAPVTATPRTVPGAPGTPATAPNEGRVTLTWTAPSESGGAPVTDYVIEHRTLPLGSWTVFADTVTTGTTVSVTGLVNGTAYELRVAAVNEAGAGAWSSIVSATPRTTASAPGTPVATVGNAQLQLGWTAPSSDGGAAITDYTVEYRAVGETVWVELADGVNPTPGAVVSGLTNGTAYEARVAARNAAGAGAWSPVVNATPLAVPDAPTALTATPGDGQMVLGWTAGADNGGAITDYLVEIRTGGGSWSTFADGTTATTGATVTGLTNGTTYELRVAAVNAAGTGPWAGPVSTAPRTTPTAPTAVAATPDDAAIDLSWAVPASDGGAAVTDYQVRFRPIGNVTWTTVDDGTSTATTLTVSGLDNGTGYELEVRAVNAAGAGPWAGPATATPRTTPGSPGALTATPDNGQVALGWSAPAADGGAAVTDYVIEYRTLPSGSWTVFPDVVGTGTSATITGLVNGTGHAFRVSAVNAAGAGTPAGPVDATPRTVADAPGAPSVTPGDGELAVSWSAPAADGGAAITDYALEYRTLPSGSWTAVADGVSAATDRTLTGLTNGTAYEVRVAAVNAAGTGAWSGAAAGTPRRSAGAPTGLSATPGNTIVVLAWTAPGSDGGSPLTDYAVEYRELPSGSWTGFADGSSATTGVTVAGLANGTTYELRVAAVNAAGSGAWSDPVTATPRTVPGTPTALAATPGDTTVDLTWTAPAHGGAAITDYTIEYRALPSGTWTTYADAVTAGTGVTVTGLTNGTTYELRVAAVNAAGTGPWSTAATATPRTTPTTPTALTATPGDTTIALAWIAPGSDGGNPVTDYTVEYRALPSGSWTAFADGAGTTTSATVTGLTNGTTYELRVAAVNAGGTGGWSDPATATPRTTPVAPASLTATPADHALVLAWSAPGSNGGATITDYTIEYRALPSGGWTVFADAVTAGTGVTVTGLTNGTAYELRVAAVNAAGVGPWSAPATGTPRSVPGIPGSLAATPGDTTVALTWTAPAADGGSPVTDYTVELRIAGDTTWTVFADGTSATTGATVTGLANGTTYEVRVTAVNAAGSGTPTGDVSATPRTTPAAPTSLTATAGNTTVALTWTAPTNGGAAITDYTVEYRALPSGTWTTYPDAVTAATTATVTGLTNGTAYELRVAAVNAAGTGPSTAPASATPRTTPSAPTGLTATPGDTTVALAWTAPGSDGGNPVTDYAVELRIAGETAWTVFADGTSAATGATVTGLTNGTTYELRVAAVNAAGTGAWSSLATATPRTPPDAPTALVATPGDTTVTLAWTAPGSNGGAAITDYSIQYSTDGGTTWLPFADATSAATGAAVTGLTNGTPHQFRVSATNAAGTGPWSATASTTPRTTPAAPTGLTAAPGNTTVALTWTAPADGGAPITDYTIEYRALPSGSWTTFADAVTSSTTATVTGLANGTTYELRVSATNAAGTGPVAGPVTATPRTTPAAPTGLTAAPGNTTVALSWTAPADGGAPITDYTIEFRALPSGSWTTFSDAVTSSTTATVTGLANGTTYELRVSGTNAAGTGASTSPATATPRTTPAAPTGLTATPGDTTVALTWTAPTDGGAAITDYTVEYRALPSGSWTTFADGTSSTTGLTVTGLVNGTGYEFRVAAVNAAGAGPSAGPVTATPRTTPAAPTGLSADPGNTTTTLTWTAPTSDGGAAITDYAVEYSTDGGTSWTPFADGTSIATSTTVTGLTNGTTHQVRVAAVNAAGTGPWSTSATTTPRAAPGAPLALSATAGDAEIALTWNAPTSDGGATITDYTVEYRESGATTWVLWSDPVSTTTGATLTGLTNGTTYEFRVAAVNAAGTGSWTTPVQATPRTVPAAPTGVTATPGGSFTLTVAWTAPVSMGGAPVTDYTLQYSTDGGAAWTPYTDGVSTATTATVSGLVDGTSHLVRVAAVNAAGTGEWSTPVTATPSSFTDATAALNLGDLGSSFDAEWGDRDGDGDLDLVIVQYNSTSYLSGLNILHRNNGDGTFTRGTFGSSGNNLDAAFGDYDGDGDLDLHLAKSGSSSPGQLNLLYRNDGASTFSTASAGIGSNRNSWDGAWADYDGDGDLDLHVANNTQTGGSAANLLYRNNGAGSFTDAAAAAGVAGNVGSVSAVWADYDDDGDPDLYVSNGGGASVLHRNEGDGTFTEVTAATGVTVPGTARGTTFGDYDGDGDLDLYVPNSVGAEVLFQNDGDGTFTDVTTTAGLLGDVGTTIDGQWADTDNDGDLDLVVGRSSGVSRLYRNDGDGTFTASDLELGAVSDLELADFDRDGDLDLISANGSGANVFLRNDRNPSAGTSQAVQLTRGGAVNRHAVTVDLLAGASRVATRVVGAAPVLFTGLNPATSYTLRYRCHGGAVVTSALGAPSATLASVEQVCPPAAPTGVAATPGTSQVTLTWTAPTLTNGSAVSDYAVEYSTDGGTTWTSFTDGTSTATSATVTGLANGTAHLFRVAAVNAAGTGAWSTATSATPTEFSSVAAAAGIGHNGNTHATAWGDHDGDGDLDLYIVNDAQANVLYRNNGNGTFTDITAAAGVGSVGDGHAAAWGDLDNDADLDLYIAYEGRANVLYRNNGNSTFTDITTAAGVGDTTTSMHAAWGDYDNDGDLDLHVANHQSANMLYRNNGNSTFTNVAPTVGVAGVGPSYEADWGDYDGDGDLDLHVARLGAANVLYRNNDNGTFTDVATTSGVAHAGDARDTDWVDYDNDGDLDLSVTNQSQANVLYRNNDDGTFTDVAATSGVAHAGNSRDADWGDFDGDGDLDLYIGNFDEPSVLYRNNGNGTFTDVTAIEGVAQTGPARDVNWVDVDGDGDRDVYVANYGAANTLFVNGRNPATGTSQAVRLTRDGDPTLIAVTVDLMAGATRVATRIVDAAPIVFTGLHPTTSYALRYRCPGGTLITAAIGLPTAALLTNDRACPPGAPTTLTASTGDGQITLSWAAPAATNGAAVSDYAVEYSTDGGTTWTSFTDGTSTATSATVTGLANGTAHLFRVAAVNAAGTGAWTASAAATPAGPPSAPLDLSATPGDGSVTLTWNPPAANGSPITDYTIDFRALPSGSFSSFADGVSTATTATVTGLGNGTSYELRVRGVNAAGSGAWATTEAMPVGPWTPAQLPNLALWYDAADASTLTVSGGLVDEWRDKSGNGSHLAATGTARPGFTATGFDGRPAVTFDGVNDQLALVAPVGISRNTTGQTIMAVLERTGGETTFGTVFGSVTSTAGYARSTLFVGSTAVQVGGRRLDSDGYQFASRSATGRMVAGGVFDWGNAALHLGVNGSWTSRSGGFQTAGATSDTASSAGGIGNAGLGEFFGGSVPEVVVTRSALSIADRNRLEGYLAHKWGTAGSLPADHPFRNHPPMISPPTAPTSLTATGDSQAVTLSWTAPANPGITAVTDYLVDYREDGSSTWTRFADDTSATTSATVTGLTIGTLYEFRVAAVNSLGAGAWSDIVTATPPHLGLAYADTNFALGGPDTLLPTVTGGAASGRTFTLDAGTLPSGVSLDPTTGALTTTGATYTDAVDVGFAPSVNGTVEAIAFQADGKVLLGGSFTTVNGSTRGRIARLNADGTLDPGFSPTFSDTVEVITVEPDGQILVGGQFLTVGGATRNRIARLNDDGTLDTTFNPNAGSTVYAIALQSDGKIVIGGGFGTVDGQARARIARLNADGSLDNGFNPGAGAGVSALAIQSDGKILLGGSFTQVAGTTRNRIARVNADGTLDTTFNPGAGNTVNALAVQTDGRILVGGAFTTIGGQTRNNIARLTAAGVVETLPNLTSNGDVNTLLQLPDGTTAFGGGFTTLSGQTRNRIARLALGGSLDTTWNPSSDGAVNALVADPNGRLVAGGAFTTLGGQARSRIARFGGVPGYPATISIRVTDPSGTATATFALQAGAS